MQISGLFSAFFNFDSIYFPHRLPDFKFGAWSLKMFTGEPSTFSQLLDCSLALYLPFL